MEPILVTAISEILIFILCQLVFIQRRRQDFKASLYILLIGVSFLFTGYLFLMQALGFGLPFTPEIKIIQTVMVALLLILTVAKISGIKKIEFLIPLLFIPLITFFYNIGWQFITMSIALYISGIVFFILFLLSTREIKYSGLFGLAYIISLIIITLTSGLQLIETVLFIPNILLLLAFTYFMRYGLEFNHFIHPHKFDMKKSRNLWISFLRLMVYITLLNVSIFASSIVLHELGHLATGNFYGCEGGQIIIMDLLPETPDPYTELTCPEPVQEIILALSGFFFVIPFGAVFLFLRRFPEKNFAYVIFGLAIQLGALDMLVALPYPYIPYVFMFVGMFIIALGELLLIYDYTEHKNEEETPKHKKWVKMSSKRH